MNKPSTLQLTIEDLAFGGQGVGKHEGKVVFAEGGLPGDTVEIRIFKNKANYCEGRVVNVITPSPYRIKAACKHFDICGGCKWQNYEYDMQLKYKADQLRQQLIRIGGIENPPIEPIISARKTFFYRNKMEYSFNQGENGELLLGLHYAGYFDKIFNLEKCLLQSETANQIVNFVRQESNRLGLPAYHIKDHTGLLRFLVVREGKFTDEILVNIVTGGDFENYVNRLIELGEKIVANFGKVKSMIWSINSRKANIAQMDSYYAKLENGVINGRDHIYEKLNQYKFKISAASFFQTNSYQAQLLYDAIAEYGGFEKTDTVCDLYCGTGTIALYISGLVRSVVGVETVPEAIADAKANATLNSVNNVKFLVGKVEDIIADLNKCDKLIIDPPRAGMHPKALKGIMQMAPPTIIYVSCNPSTLARDGAELIKGGYSLKKSVPVDMFPHTYHIESVSRFVRT